LQGLDISELVPSEESAVYFSESPPVKGATKAILPANVQSLYVRRIASSGEESYLVMWSALPRALSKRDQKWASAIAEKLAPFFK
jgi:hypothetical protein